MSAAASGGANLNLMRRLDADWGKTRSNLKERNKELRVYVPPGGGSAPAIFLEAYDVNPKTPFKRSCEVLLLQVGSDIDPSKPKPDYVKEADDGTPTVVLPVKPSAKALAGATDGLMRPEVVELRSHTVVHLDTQQTSMLDKFRAGQVVVLNGINVRPWVSTNQETGDQRWSLDLQVSMIEAVPGLNLANMWPVASGMGTDRLRPNTKPFVDGVFGSRYNRFAFYRIACRPTGTTVEERDDQLDRMARQCNRTDLQPETWATDLANNNNPWRRPEWNQKPESISASLNLCHNQWTTEDAAAAGDDPSQMKRETSLVNTTFYEEKLLDFGILDCDAWESIAPSIFRNLKFVIFGYVDTKATASSFGGLSSDDDEVSFGLAISPRGIMADYHDCYSKIGMPVTSGFVADHQQKASGTPGNKGPYENLAASIGTKRFEEILTDVVPVTGKAANATVARHLVDTAEKDDVAKPTFVALVNVALSDSAKEALAGLSPEEGSMILTARMDNNEQGLLDHPNLHAVYKSITWPDSLHVICFAMCKNMIQEAVVAKRNEVLMTYMIGHNAQGTKTIEDAPTGAPAPTAEAAAASSSGITDDVEDDDIFEESDAETPKKKGARVSKKKDTKKRTKKKARA